MSIEALRQSIEEDTRLMLKARQHFLQSKQRIQAAFDSLEGNK